MTERIRFHIIVPVYKVEAYLNECVESVLGQSYGNFILYLIDDGSPDNCPALCDSFAQRDPRVKVLHKENRGPLHSRVCGLAMAWEQTPGPEDYAVFPDSDDLLLPRALETLAEIILRLDCDCVMYGAETFGEGVTPYQLTVTDRERLVTDRKVIYRQMLFQGGHQEPVWFKAVRLSLLSHDPAACAPYDGLAAGEDRLESLEIYRKSRSFCLTPEVLYRYRIRAGSMMRVAGRQDISTDFRIYEAERAMLESDPEYAGAPMAAYRSYRIHALTGKLAAIAELKVSREERKALFREIKQTAYWRDFLDGGGYDLREVGKMALLYEAFRRGWYELILVMVAAYRLIWKE